MQQRREEWGEGIEHSGHSVGWGDSEHEEGLRLAESTGRCWSRHLKEVVGEIGKRQGTAGAVTLGWVKPHIGIEGIERADREAKSAAEQAAVVSKQMTGEGVRQWVKEDA